MGAVGAGEGEDEGDAGLAWEPIEPDPPKAEAGFGFSSVSSPTFKSSPKDLAGVVEEVKLTGEPPKALKPPENADGDLAGVDGAEMGANADLDPPSSDGEPNAGFPAAGVGVDGRLDPALPKADTRGELVWETGLRNGEEVGVASLPKAPNPEAGLKPEDALFKFPNAPVVVGVPEVVNFNDDGPEGGGLSRGEGDPRSLAESGEEDAEFCWATGGVLFPKKELLGVVKPANAEATGLGAGEPPPKALAGEGDSEVPPPKAFPLLAPPPNADPAAIVPNADGPSDENALNPPAAGATVVVPEGELVFPLPNVEVVAAFAKPVGPDEANALNPPPPLEGGVAGVAPEDPNPDCPNTDAGFCPKPVCPKPLWPNPVCPKEVLPNAGAAVGLVTLGSLVLLPPPNAPPPKAPPPPNALGFGLPNAPLLTAPKAPNPVAGLIKLASEKVEGDGVEGWFAGWFGGNGSGLGEPNNPPPTALGLLSDSELELPRDRPPNEGVASPIETEGVEESGGADGGLLETPNALGDEAKAEKPPPVEEPKVLVVVELPNAEALFDEPNAEDGAEDCAPNEPWPNAGCCPNAD
jgi:hypothetical protein